MYAVGSEYAHAEARKIDQYMTDHFTYCAQASSTMCRTVVLPAIAAQCDEPLDNIDRAELLGKVDGVFGFDASAEG